VSPRRPLLVRTALSTALLASATIVGGCGAQATPGAAVSHGLAQASAGLCQALQGLPDVEASARDFTNRAHDPLHQLAADQRLDRSLQATVLQAMQQVEADYSRSVGAGILYGDLQALKDRTNVALRALGEEPPACPV
jgi:hypothetical protein